MKEETQRANQWAGEWYVSSIRDLIKKEASKGRSELFNPFSHFLQWPTDEQVKYILNRLTELGYTISTIEKRNAYTTIKW